MAPPSLPTEILAHILELMCEPPFDDLDAPPPFADLLACSRTSRALGSLARGQLYRRVEIRIRDQITYTDSALLESTLLRFKRLSQSTQVIDVFWCTRGSAVSANLQGAMALRSISICLKAATCVSTIEVGGFSGEATRDILSFVAQELPTLRRLILDGRNADDPAISVVDLASVLAGFSGLGGLAVYKKVDLRGALSAALQRPQLSKLSFLDIGPAAYGALVVVASSIGPSLRHLVLDCCGDWDPPHFHQTLPTFVNLSQLELFLPDLLIFERIIPTLTLCHSLKHLEATVDPVPDRNEATLSIHLDLTVLPPSLKTLDISNTGILLQPIERFYLARACYVSPDLTNWTEEEERRWDELEAARFGAGGSGGNSEWLDSKRASG